MKIKKLLALLLAMALVVSMAAGCSNEEATETTEAPVIQDTEGVSGDEGTVEEEFSYPVADGGTITWWAGTNQNWSNHFTSLADTEWAKALQEQTGITIEFKHPASGQADTEFNLMVAEGNYPDLLQRIMTSYAGGPDKAIEDGVIIPLNDVIDKYCPNLKAFLAANPEIDAMVKTDAGVYYCFPFVYETAELGATQGLFLREDWLNELGLEVPETIDEWHTVLTAFKEKKGAEAPFSVAWGQLNSSVFVNAYGVGGRTFYVDENGKAQYGAVQDGYKEFLMTMKQWIDEGLIDPDMLSLSSDQVTAKMTTGLSGASYGFAASGMQKYIQTGKQNEAGYNLVAAPVPVVNKGDVATMSAALTLRYTGQGVSISTDCENVELAARLLDYGYSAEGRLLYNYGVEGESYEMVNGVPTYTDEILKPEDGWTIGEAIAKYAVASYVGPFVQELNYLKQYYQEPNVAAAPAVWTVEGAQDHKWPTLTPTPEEAAEYGALLTDVNTYVNEEIVKFVLGERSFDEWDEFVKTAEELGLTRVLEIRQASLDRYLAR